MATNLIDSIRFNFNGNSYLLYSQSFKKQPPMHFLRRENSSSELPKIEGVEYKGDPAFPNTVIVTKGVDLLLQWATA